MNDHNFETLNIAKVCATNRDLSLGSKLINPPRTYQNRLCFKITILFVGMEDPNF